MESLADFLGLNGGPPAAPDPIDHLENLSGVAFCQAIVASVEYRRSIFDRVSKGTLPPAVECRILDHAMGKPPERLEHTGKDGAPIEMVSEVRRVIVRAQQQQDSDSEESKPKYATH